MRWVVCIAVFGCNQVFDIDPTLLVDAPLPIDAPPAPMCPPPGGTPIFSGPVTVVSPENCSFYVPSESGSLAVASCSFGTAQFDPGGSPAMVTWVPAAASIHGAPQLAPEGDRLIANVYTTSSSSGQFQIFERTSGATWTQVDTVPGTTQLSDHSSPPSRRDTGPRVLTWRNGSVAELDGGAGWSVVHSYTADELGVSSLQFPTLTPDGLRMMFVGFQAIAPNQRALYLADRSSISENFGVARQISGDWADVFTLYMPNDCSKVIWTGAQANSAVYSKAQRP